GSAVCLSSKLKLVRSGRVAGCNSTGTLTRPKLMAPFHIARDMAILLAPNASEQRALCIPCKALVIPATARTVTLPAPSPEYADQQRRQEDDEEDEEQDLRD